MLYRLRTDAAENRLVEIMDTRTLGELAIALAKEGFIASTHGDVSEYWASIGALHAHSFEFKVRGPIALMAPHVIQIEEIVVPADATVTET